jgi:predicted nucleic acid-binding protein
MSASADLELADTSAWTKHALDPAVDADFRSRLRAGRIATCQMVAMELLWTTRDGAELAARRSALGALRACPIGPGEWARATDVFERLAADGPLPHRRVKPAELLIAAAAESAGLPVCHYEADFELIAAVTGQPVRAIAPLGSL